jgi:hypothetical protein
MIPAALSADPETRVVADRESVDLLRRIVESLPLRRPGRYTVYLGRPDPVAVRAAWDHEVALMRAARRAVVSTAPTTPLPTEADRRDPGLGWLSGLSFSAVLGDETAMAVIDDTNGERAWLLTNPAAVRRFIAAIEAELARPDPQLLAV